MIWFVLFITILQFCSAIATMFSLSNDDDYDFLANMFGICLSMFVMIWGVVLITLWVVQ